MRIVDYFDRGASLYPDNIALIDETQRLDYRSVQRDSQRIAAALSREPGLAKGAHVAVYSSNDARVMLAVLGINRADMIWQQVHAANAVETNIEILRFFDTEALFFHSGFEAQVAQIKSQAPGIGRFICLDRPSSHGPSLEDWLEGCEGPFVTDIEDPEGIALLQPTGGTTGPSKGVMQSHRALENVILNMMLSYAIGQGSRHLVVAPMTHAAGLLALAHLPQGGTNVILPGFEPLRVLETIERERITHLFLPPTALYALLAHPQVRDFDYSALQSLQVAAAPVSPEKFKEAVGVFGPVLGESYGQTETMFPLLIKTAADYLLPEGGFDEAVLRSSGRPTVPARVEIMDDQGWLLGPGKTGEIVVRGPSVMKGYYKNPEATAEVSQFGWHHTTNVGIKDERGYVTLVDRKKDMIISGGFNVYPVEIENVLNGHPAVLASAVIGVPDEKWGEAVKAIVQLKPDADTDEAELEQALIALCKEKLGRVKAPKSVDIWAELPRSAVGKLLKREIRKEYWKDQWRAV